jgi:hypothetical protein
MRYLIGLAMLMVSGGIPSAAMANNHCSTEMYQRADASLANAAAGWGSLLRHQKAFGPCDDGALAEGYSDAVVTLLAHRWDQFDAFVGLSARDPAFRRWAIRHIDASASTHDLAKVARNAVSCTGSAKAKDLCRDVAKAAKNALSD